jgi:hypothetical protein
MYYIACSPDRWREEDDEPNTVMCFYQDQTDEKWFYHILHGWRVMSAVFPEPSPGTVRKVYSLSENGEIECFSREGISIERIAEAGLDEQGEYGYVHKIRFIGERFYVCGYAGQVYRKEGSQWVHFDKGLLGRGTSEESVDYKSVPKDDPQALMKFFSKITEDRRSLFDIDGLSESSIYVVGSEGFIAYHNGIEWDILKPVTAADLLAVHIVSEQEVWIVGSRGAVLRGNAKEGFKVLSGKAIDEDFYAISQFNNEIYISGEYGIYLFKNGRRARQKISDTANLRGVSCIEAKDGVLWALSEKKLLRLRSGCEWEIFEYPNNDQ